MTTTLLLGGARSGKSSRALALAFEAETRGEAVVFVVTAEAFDNEMADRIDRHKEERPAHWKVVEAPYSLVEGVQSVDPRAFVVIDCLSFWVANAMMHETSETHDYSRVQTATNALCELLRARVGSSVVVSNEVGMGVVPEHRLGREFRDVLGRANATVARHVDEAFLVVAGRLMRLD